ncbi:universal stress protein [Nocardioides currus]|nr:universal stress protein [Nocardioides currus]
MDGSTATPLTRSTPTSGAVVVGCVGDAPSGRALGWAAQEAASAGRRLVVAHVRTVSPALQQSGYAVQLSATPPVDGNEAQLDAVVTRTLARFPGLDVEHVEATGDPADELVLLSRGAHLLVLGSRGTGAVRTIPSAQVGTRAARSATCPVVVVPRHRVGLARRGVLAGVSVRHSAPEVLEHAFSHAGLHDLPLTIVHASKDTLRAPAQERDRWLAEAVSGFGELHPDVAVSTQVATGRPARVLLQLAEQMSLLVVGRHLAGGGHLLGHVRSSIADRAPCPVMVVPPPEGSRPAG